MINVANRREFVCVTSFFPLNMITFTGVYKTTICKYCNAICRPPSYFSMTQKVDQGLGFPDLENEIPPPPKFTLKRLNNANNYF